MFSRLIASKSRTAVGFFLFLGLVLTVFLLSGVTQSAPAIRNVYLLKLHYTSPPDPRTFKDINSDDDIGTNKPTLTPQPTPEIPGIDNGNDNVDEDEQDLIVDRPIEEPSESIIRIPRPTPTPEKTINTPPSKSTTVPLSSFAGIPMPPRVIDFITASLDKRHMETPMPHPHLPKRQLEPPEGAPDDEILREIISLKFVDLDVFFGYFGFCVGGADIPLRCSNKRPKNGEDLKRTLFPGEYNPDGSVNSTALTMDKDPQNLLSLGLQLQRTISPVPVVGAIIAFGIAWFISMFMLLTSHSGVGDTHGNADKITLGFATLGFLLLLTAVSFLKVAGDAAYEILNGSGAENGFLLEVAGVEATPGYHAQRIGAAALLMVAFVVAGMMWCLGIGRRESAGEERVGSHGGLVGGLLGRFMGIRKSSGYNDPGWKSSIGQPMPYNSNSHHMDVYPTSPPPGTHPAFLNRSPNAHRGMNYV